MKPEKRMGIDTKKGKKKALLRFLQSLCLIAEMGSVHLVSLSRISMAETAPLSLFSSFFDRLTRREKKKMQTQKENNTYGKASLS